MTEFAHWESFYVIVGSAGGALIGLQFVVMTLIADRPPPRVAEVGAAFGTPVIVHFGAVLLLSALASAPWHTITPPAILWGLLGLSGAVYVVIVARRMRTQTAYKPDRDDWVFNVVLPLVAYAVLAFSALAAPSNVRDALFGIATAALMLLFIGIHNSWDAISYHVLVSRAKAKDEQR